MEDTPAVCPYEAGWGREVWCGVGVGFRCGKVVLSNHDMRIATIDVGTNTALLLVADVRGGVVEPLQEETRFVRLGEGVDQTGRISDAAMGRLRAVLLEYREIGEDLGATEFVVTGTSASRDAENREALQAFVRRETGLSYEILTGEEEAVWTFAGAVSAFEDLEGLCATLDIGGGSTEITIGEAGRSGATVQYRHSFDAGAVRLTERLFSGQPPAKEEVEEAEALVTRMLDRAEVPWDPSLPLIGVAGTISALALVNLGLPSWDGLGSSVMLDAELVHGWRERLAQLTYDETLGLNPAVMMGRADVMLAGVLILDVAMRYFDIPVCHVSPRDLRHGLALREVTKYPDKPGQALE